MFSLISFNRSAMGSHVILIFSPKPDSNLSVWQLFNIFSWYITWLTDTLFILQNVKDDELVMCAKSRFSSFLFAQVFFHSGIHEQDELPYHHFLSLSCSPIPVLKASSLEFVHPCRVWKNKKCCPIPKGFSAPCGSDGNRGTCQELIIHDWTFKYSHCQPFQNGDERHNWPHALYH